MTFALSACRFINGDVAFNISQIEKAMAEAHGRADMICFGEAFLQGFDAFRWSYEKDKIMAVAQDGEIFARLCGLTGKYGIDLLVGYLEREGDRLYSSCAVIADGKLLHNYRRISIGWKEYTLTDGHYCEGDIASDFQYRGRSFRIALCGDLWDHPERFKTEGILLWPVYLNFSYDEWQQYETEYAEQAALAADKALLINSVTDSPESIGGAFLLQKGRITARLPYGEEGVLYVEV